MVYRRETAENARSLLANACDNLFTAQLLLSHSHRMYRIACFHARKSVEACLRACLCLYDISPPEVSHLDCLVDIIRDYDAALADDLPELDSLTCYNDCFDYLEPASHATWDDAESAVGLARTVERIVASRINQIPV
jgi:HEPN domain-containing protein